MLENPTEGRIKSARQVTNRETRGGLGLLMLAIVRSSVSSVYLIPRASLVPHHSSCPRAAINRPVRAETAIIWAARAMG